MLTFDNDRLLQVWETMWRRTPCEQAVALVGAAFPELSQEEVLAMPIGRRDGLLLMLRKWLFGPRAEVLVTCPACGEPSEFGFDMDDLLTEPAPLDAISIVNDGREVCFRLPTSADLLALQHRAEGNARQLLAARCLKISAEEATSLSDHLVEAIADQMSERDPQANVAFAVKCAACSREFSTRFDIVSFLWSEINVWAQRLLGEVHLLAATYGWSEASILAMNPTRRQIYLNLASS